MKILLYSGIFINDSSKHKTQEQIIAMLPASPLALSTWKFFIHALLGGFCQAREDAQLSWRGG